MSHIAPSDRAVSILLRNLLQAVIPQLERLNAALSDLAITTETLLENWPAPTVAGRFEQALADLEARVRVLEGSHPALAALVRERWPMAAQPPNPPSHLEPDGLRQAFCVPHYLEDGRLPPPYGGDYGDLPPYLEDAPSSTGTPWPDESGKVVR